MTLFPVTLRTLTLYTLHPLVSSCQPRLSALPVHLESKRHSKLSEIRWRWNDAHRGTLETAYVRQHSVLESSPFAETTNFNWQNLEVPIKHGFIGSFVFYKYLKSLTDFLEMIRGNLLVVYLTTLSAPQTRYRVFHSKPARLFDFAVQAGWF